MLTKSDLTYDLPEELIAQNPPEDRGTCRLMVLDRKSGSIGETVFNEIGTFFTKKDTLVLNNTKVINARLNGNRVPTGGAVELLLLEKKEDDTWKVMVRPGRRCRKGQIFSFPENLTGTVTEELGMGRALVQFRSQDFTEKVLKRVGSVPLPPYIKRSVRKADELRYQTVFAEKDGAVAAPTAGLHFTDELLVSLREQGVRTEYITLHVGPGTFQPLREEILEDNQMEEERYCIPEHVAGKLKSARAEGGRIAAVGTTVVRALESVDFDQPSCLEGRTSIFIHPPYRFRNVDLLLTNFHLPGSSLISLVGSFAGLDFIMEAYRKAVEKGYRFYSYGDAMLII